MSKVCVAAFAVAGVLLLAPAGALADSCQGGTSAVNIYSECIPTASGGSHHNRGGHHKPTGTTTTPSYTNTTPAVAVKPKLSKNVSKSLAHAGHDKKILKNIVSDPWLGATHAIETSASFRTTTPTALGSVFDIGSGPTVLFAMLAALAIALLCVGLRGRRQQAKL